MLECCRSCGSRVRASTFNSSFLNAQASAPSLKQLDQLGLDDEHSISWSWRDIFCVQTCRHLRDRAEQSGMACCCSPCKPRYRRLVDAIYPGSITDGINGANLNKLTFYASSHPEKVDRIGEYLAQRFTRDLYKLRYTHVRIAVDAMTSLLQCCHSSPSLPQLSEHYLRIVQKLLESNIPQLEQIATESFVNFSNIEESATCYHRQYDFFISKFSQMCHANGPEAKKIRLCGLKGLRGVVWKSVTDDLHPNIWERQHMDKIVPSFLYNIEGDDAEDVADTSAAYLEGPFTEDAANREETAKALAETCLRELMGKTTFGSLRAVLEPVLKHLNAHKKWMPPAKFAAQIFRTILYSIQTQNSYFVIQELINHLDTMSSSDASVRIGIATVLSSIVSIAGTSIGPLLLSIFNSLLKHLRASVEFQQSDKCPSQDDEKTYQETLINAMGDFANTLPDYQKVEMMMFTVGNIPLSADDNQRNGETFLQHVLVKTLLKVATKYRTAYLATVFSDSFIDILQRLAVAKDAQVRLATQQIFHTLLDRHDNVSTLLGLPFQMDIADVQLNVEKCSRADQMFLRKHSDSLMQTLFRAAVILPDDATLTAQTDALLCTLLLLCIELGYDENVIELFRLCFALQALALDPAQPFSDSKRAHLHNMVARYLNVSSQLLAIPTLCQHVHHVICARSSQGPPCLDIMHLKHDEELKLAPEKQVASGSQPVVLNASEGAEERIELESIGDNQEMLFSKSTIYEALKNSGKEASRLLEPFLPAHEFIRHHSYDLDTESEDDDVVDGKKAKALDVVADDDQSLDLSFEWTPPASTVVSRRNTVFSLAGNVPPMHVKTHELCQTGLPLTVSRLIDYFNSPYDPAEEEQKDVAKLQKVVEHFRSTPFKDLVADIEFKEAHDLSSTIARLCARNLESANAKNVGRSQKPASIMDLQLDASFIM